MAGFDSIKKTLLNCFGVSTKAERLKSISYYGSLTISQINDEIKICDFFLTKKKKMCPTIRKLWEVRKESLTKQRVQYVRPYYFLSSFASYCFIVSQNSYF